MLTGEAAATARQARTNFWRYVFGKLKLSKQGSAYGSGIRAAVEAFYASIDRAEDARISGEFGKSVIAICERIATASGRSPVTMPAQAAGKLSAQPKVLVLGASGFIGKELVRQLVAAGHATRVLVRGKGRLPASLQTDMVEVIEGDAAQQTDLDAALAGITHVYHLARPVVKTWADYQQHDIEVTRLIAERCLAAGVKRLIYTGTIDSYYAGARAGTITEATPLDPRIERRNLYARSKAHCEAILMAMHRERKLPVVIARPGIVIGRGGSPLHWGVGMWHHGAICRLWGDGNNPLPLVLVEDVAAGLVRLLDAPGVEGESFNFVADPCLSARDYIRKVLSRRCGEMDHQAPDPSSRASPAKLPRLGIAHAARRVRLLESQACFELAADNRPQRNHSPRHRRAGRRSSVSDRWYFFRDLRPIRMIALVQEAVAPEHFAAVDQEDAGHDPRIADRLADEVAL